MSIITRTRTAVNPTREDRMPYTAADLEWAAQVLNENATDYDVLEIEWPGTREEYDRWLDSIAPTDAELEHRDRCDAFLGHED